MIPPQNENERAILDPTPDLTPTEEQTSKNDEGGQPTTTRYQEMYLKSQTPEALQKRTLTLKANRKGFFIAAIRTFCLECTGTPQKVRECDGQEICPLWHARTITAMRKISKGKLRALIKANCIDCTGGQNPDHCTSPKCKLYRMRFGRRIQADF